jgi:hypothetical protein
MKASQPCDIGSRLELFIDDYLIEALQGDATLQLHRPTPREAALVTDRPWEGNMCGYVTVFEDKGHDRRFRMYYKCSGCALVDGPEGQRVEIAEPLRVALAESEDGVHWQRPELVPFQPDCDMIG